MFWIEQVPGQDYGRFRLCLAGNWIDPDVAGQVKLIESETVCLQGDTEPDMRVKGIKNRLAMAVIRWLLCMHRGMHVSQILEDCRRSYRLNVLGR